MERPCCFNLSVWVCECVSVWVCVWVCECVSVRVSREAADQREDTGSNEITPLFFSYFMERL